MPNLWRRSVFRGISSICCDVCTAFASIRASIVHFWTWLHTEDSDATTTEYWKKTLMRTGVYAVIAALIAATVYGICIGTLGLAGFGAGGVAAASMASGIQSGIGSVAAGSIFAFFQSAAAGGSAATVIAGISGAVAGLASFGIWALGRSDA